MTVGSGIVRANSDGLSCEDELAFFSSSTNPSPFFDFEDSLDGVLRGELLGSRGGGRFTRCLVNDIDAWYGAERMGPATAAHEDKDALNDLVDELELEVELVLDPDW